MEMENGQIYDICGRKVLYLETDNEPMTDEEYNAMLEDYYQKHKDELTPENLRKKLALVKRLYGIE